MKLTVHSLKFDADEKLLNFIQKKVDKLETYYDRVVDVEIYLKLNNDRTENKTVEMKLNIPGSQLFSKEQSKSFEEATDVVVDALRRQLRKYKDKHFVSR